MNPYAPKSTDNTINLTGMEYFGCEQYDTDIKNIVADQTDYVQILGKFVGNWEDELYGMVENSIEFVFNDRQGHKDYLYMLEDITPYSSISKMPEAMGFVPGQYNMRMQLQRPGSLMARHTDPPYSVNKILPEELKDQVVQVLVPLAHWEFGQIIGFNNRIVSGWTPGTIIYCDYNKVQHFTANCSYHSRPLLIIAGVPSDELKELIETKQSKDFIL